jgi:hypothetical protein
VHPLKFLKRALATDKPKMSANERAEKLGALSAVIAAKRKDAVDARKASGVEKIWLTCEEAYLGMDDSNRHEFDGAQWAKPSSMSGPLTRESKRPDDSKSTAYVRLTSRYVDHAASKMGEIILPIDDKAFSISATPVPDLIKQLDDKTPVAHPETGQPLMQSPDAIQSQTPQAAQALPPSQAPTPLVPVTAADVAQAVLDKANDSAKAAEKRIYDWMVESAYPAEARKVIHDAARIGTGVLKGPFPDSKVSRAVTTIENGVAIQIEKKIVPSVKWVDTWNLYPDDACGENIHDGDYLFERDFLSKKRLLKLKDQEDYISDQIDRVIEEGPGKCYLESSSQNDTKIRKRYEIWYYYGTLKREDMELAGAVGIEDLPEDQEDVHAIVSMVNDTVIRAVINPLDSGAFPYRVIAWSRRPGSWTGVGVAEQISVPQRMVVAATRALLNNAGLSSGVQIILDQAGVIPADGQWVITPNKIWYKTSDSTASNVRDAFFAVVIPSVQREMMAIIEYSMKLAEEASGIPLITQGQTGPSSPDTFGQAELQDNNAHTWLRNVGYRFDDMITEPLINDFYEYLLLDPEVPNEEKGDFQINAHGSVAMVERAIQEQTLMGMLGASANPAFKVDPVKLFAEICKAKRIDPRNIQYSKEEQDKMAQQPAPPPLPIAVEQLKGQNALQLQQAKSQAELQMEAADMQREQQALQNGQATPHMAMASGKIEQERIRATTAQIVEASRAHAEEARADKELEIANQNGQFKIQEMQLQKELALLQYAHENQQTLDQVKADLAKTAIQEQTKRQLASAELQLAQSEGDKNRTVDLHKHTTSLIHDEVSTPVTP